MMKNGVVLSASMLALMSCGVMDRLVPRPKAAETAAPLGRVQALAPAGAQTAETLDRTTEAERAAAIADPVAGARELGRTSVALGSPAEQGFWLKSPLVTAPGKGKVVTAAGASVAVDLLPGAGGAMLSLAAYRALGLALTDLPEVTVYAD
jgi:hypothetical protein